MPSKCYVISCPKPSVANGLCQMHDKRVKRHGDVNAGHSDDWGKREKHPAYKAWCGLRRYHRQNIQPDWVDDFWKFVSEIPEKPEHGKAFRPDPLQPWSKDNFYWREPQGLSDDQKQYAREWHRKSRETNPDYYFNQDLRRKYGVDLEWYKKKLAEQNGACAICKNPETAKIQGRTLRLAVDHSHKSGQARGLLCLACNRGLGLFKDSINSLKSAISYLSD
jgi:hypothetical protein